jgi:hypothetical protein
MLAAGCRASQDYAHQLRYKGGVPPIEPDWRRSWRAAKPAKACLQPDVCGQAVSASAVEVAGADRVYTRHDFASEHENTLKTWCEHMLRCPNASERKPTNVAALERSAQRATTGGVPA